MRKDVWLADGKFCSIRAYKSIEMAILVLMKDFFCKIFRLSSFCQCTAGKLLELCFFDGYLVMNFIVTCSGGAHSILCSVFTCSVLKTEVSNFISIKQEMFFWMPFYFELGFLDEEFNQMDNFGCVRVFCESLDFAHCIDDRLAFLLFDLISIFSVFFSG